MDVTQVGTPFTGNETLTKVNTVVQGDLGGNNLENQFTEPSQISTEIQVWTQIMEQKNDDRIEKMRVEMENKLETILKEIKSNKSASTVTTQVQKLTKSETHNHRDPKQISLQVFTHLITKTQILTMTIILLELQK